eukprot:1139463-Pelagomonas_calceolata.AAC.1
MEQDIRTLWPGLFERHGASLGTNFDLTTLAHITDGYTSGAMDMVGKERERGSSKCILTCMKAARH